MEAATVTERMPHYSFFENSLAPHFHGAFGGALRKPRVSGFYGGDPEIAVSQRSNTSFPQLAVVKTRRKPVLSKNNPWRRWILYCHRHF
jgi:hypothetical protein